MDITFLVDYMGLIFVVLFLVLGCLWILTWAEGCNG